jgi:hypothetical protein
MEIGKWIVKRIGGRRDAEFPSWRDLKSRSLAPKLSCETARGVLGWQPVEGREAFLDQAVRVHAPRAMEPKDEPEEGRPEGQGERRDPMRSGGERR